MKHFKIGYFGHDPWSYSVFEKIVNESDLSIQFVTPRYANEDLKLKALAEKHNIDYIKHPNVNAGDYIEKIKKYECDLLVCMAFDQIFKKELINLAPHKLINCHIAQLPFYRGRNALNWVLINDEKEFGLTVHYADEGIDTGDIILQKFYPICDADDFQSILDVAYPECGNVMLQAIKMIQQRSVKTLAQHKIHPTGFYCGKIEPGDEWINWSDSSRSIFNFVRGMAKPWSMSQSTINGTLIKINRVELVKDVPTYKCFPGMVVGKQSESFLVKTGDTLVKVVQYDYSGKISIGDRLLSQR